MSSIKWEFRCHQKVYTPPRYTENSTLHCSIENKNASLISASVVPAACLLAVTFVECDDTAVVTAMFIGVTAMAGMFSGVLSNNTDIAPHYAGIHHACILFCFFVNFFMCVCVCVWKGWCGSGCMSFKCTYICLQFESNISVLFTAF